MRGLRSTLVLLVVLIGLVGYIYYRGRSGETATDTREEVFAGVEADAIEEVRIKAADGETTVVRKVDNAWRVVEPLGAEADSGELSSITSSLASLDIQRVVEENATDLKQYGLEPPRIEVAFRAKGDKEPRRIDFGERTPTGGDLYARLPDQKRVFLVASYLDSTFNKNTFALRDKRVLKIDRDKADGLEVAGGSTPLQFAKSGSEWRMVKPYAARADFGAVEGAVERLASAQMQSIVDPEGGSLAKYGLDKPTATLTVSMGSSRATLILGRTENALVFAKDLSRPMIFTVAPTLKDDVVKPVSDYRRKDLFDARSFTASRIEITRGGEKLAFEKVKAGDKDVWRDAAGKDADATKVEDMLSRVTALRADAFEAAAPAALKSPVMTVTVRFDENKTETVAFGRDGGTVYAARPDEPGAGRVDAMSFEEAVKAIDALK